MLYGGLGDHPLRLADRRPQPHTAELDSSLRGTDVNGVRGGPCSGPLRLEPPFPFRKKAPDLRQELSGERAFALELLDPLEPLDHSPSLVHASKLARPNARERDEMCQGRDGVQRKRHTMLRSSASTR